MIEKITAGRDVRAGLGARGTAFRPRPQHRHSDGSDGQRNSRQFSAASYSERKKARRNGCGNGRASHPRCFLRRLAQGLGRTAHGEGNLRHGRLNSTSVCKSQAFLIRNAWLFEYPPSEYLLFSRVRLRLPVHLHENRNIHRKRKSHDRAADGNEYIRHCRWDAHP